MLALEGLISSTLGFFPPNQLSAESALVFCFFLCLCVGVIVVVGFLCVCAGGYLIAICPPLKKIKLFSQLQIFIKYNISLISVFFVSYRMKSLSWELCCTKDRNKLVYQHCKFFLGLFQITCLGQNSLV